MLRSIGYIVVITFSLLLFSCEDSLQAPTVREAMKLKWQGVYTAPPEEPEINWVYFDITLRTTMIYNGLEWDTMAVSGIDATALTWLGATDTFPANPAPNSTFFNTEDNVSYLFNGEKWDTLSYSGQDALPVQWQGSLDSEPANPEINWTYYNKTTETTYIYTGTSWKPLSLDGLNGLSMVWLGESDTVPGEPELHAAYYNTIDKASYFFNGTEWLLISSEGLQGKPGDAIKWYGILPEAPENPVTNCAYQNSMNNITYIFDGTEWQIFSTPGTDGVAIIWLNKSSNHPEPPTYNGVYQNSIDGNCYIYDGTRWGIFSVSGADGEDGLDGYTVQWRGSHSSHPSPAEEFWAYFNLLDGSSYIYKDGSWESLIPIEDNFVNLRWFGERSFPPSSPELFYAYYNTSDEISYVYDGYNWDTLTCHGKDGIDGEIMTWKGNSDTHPSNPQKNWIYYNTSNGITYQYTGSSWTPIAQSGKNGTDAEITSDYVHEWINHNDVLVLNHNLKTNNLFFIGQYYSDDSSIHNWDERDPAWTAPYELKSDVSLRTTTQLTHRSMIPLKDGSSLLITADYATGGNFSIIDKDGSESIPTNFTSSNICNVSAVELVDGTLLFSYIDLDSSRKAVLTAYDSHGTLTSETIHDTTTYCLKMVQREDNTLLFAYYNENKFPSFRTIGLDGTFSSEVHIGDSLTTTFPSDNYLNAISRNNGNVIILHVNNYIYSSIISLNDSIQSSNQTSINRIVSIENMVQSANNRIFSTWTVASGSPYFNGRDNYLVEIGEDGSIIDQSYFQNEAQNISLLSLEDNTLAISYHTDNDTSSSYSDTIITTGYPYIRIFSQDLEMASENRLPEKITDIAMVSTDGKSIQFTYDSKTYSTNLSYGTLNKSTETPVIELRRVNSNTAHLINKSGRLLELTLMAHK